MDLNLLPPDTPEGKEGGIYSQAFTYLYKLHAIDTKFVETYLSTSQASQSENPFETLLSCYNLQVSTAMAFYAELAEWMTEEEIKHFDKGYQECLEARKKIVEMTTAGKQKGIAGISPQVLDTCIRWMMQLRAFRNEKGMTMPKRGDPGSAIGAGFF